MPAINPTRLRFQIDELMNSFASPPEFHRGLRDLFSLYANRSLRFGDSTKVKPLIPMYNLPAPVIRQLQTDLSLRIAEEIQAAFLLADELWEDPFYEIKQTALFILGVAPIDAPDPILSRLKTWLSPDLDALLVSDLFSLGTRKLQARYPETWESLIKSFLDKDSPADLSIGLKGLVESLKNEDFSNLPAVFRMVSPIIHSPDRKNIHDLEDLVEVLAKKSAIETGHFLKQALSLSDSIETRRLVKQCLVFFPDPIAQDLKSSLSNE